MSGYSSYIRSLGPTSYWRLGEPSGVAAADEMGVNAGTYVGGPTLGAAGALQDGDTAMTLNASSKYALVKAGRILSGLPSATILAWASSGALVGIDAAVYCERGAAGNDIWKLELVATTGRPRLVIRNDAGTLQLMGATTGTYANNGFHQFVVTKSGTAINVYADGVLLNAFTQTPTDTFTDTVSSRIGSDQADAAAAFPGTIDEVAVWTRALSLTEIERVYAKGLSVGPTSALRNGGRPGNAG